MEKRFILIAALMIAVSAMIFAAAGNRYTAQNPDSDICVKSKSCAINYMNHLEKEQE